VTSEPEFVPTEVAARLMGMSDAALRRRIRRGLLAVYQDPADRRFRLLRVADLEEFTVNRRAIPLDAHGDV
jgi:hypothetical protein